MKVLRMDKLRAMREKHGMSRGHLADLMGIGESTLACWELGLREPRYEHLVQWCNTMHTTPNDILKGVKKNG
jgi:transcriptional regulator with XRE-family HTH domain